MNSGRYRWCGVPQCTNTSTKTPNKLFVFVPKKKTIWDKWLKLARRDLKGISPSSQLYFCEDHFDLQNDMENYMEYNLMGKVSQIRMKPGCLPTRFECQPDRKKRTSNKTERQYILKRQRKRLVEECEKEYEEAAVAAKQSDIGEVSPPDEVSSPDEALSGSSDYGTCRFCEAQGKHSSMTSAVLGGEQGNYCDMLLECFNVFMSTDDQTSSLICSQCAVRLRDARDFRLLVLRAQSGMRRATIEVEVSVSHSDMDVDIKKEPPESEGPEGSVVKLEPMEPELDIVEHEVTRRPDPMSGVSGDNVWTDGINDYGIEPKRRRLENAVTHRLSVEQMTSTDSNFYAGHPVNVEKFLEEYYYDQADDQEETDSVFEMPEDRDVIEMDEESVFLNNGCGCKKSCTDKFDRNDILKSRLDCLEQDYYCYHHINHLNLMMLGALSATADVTSQTSIRDTQKTRQRAHHVNFWFRGVSVCKKFFMFVHGLNSKKYEKILKCFKETGVEAVTHGNKKSLMTKQQRSDIVTFLNNFAEQNSLVLTGRSLENTDLCILPSSMTRTSVYEQYVLACKKDNKYPVSRPLWYRVWDNFCPNVTVEVPSEPCRTCKDLFSDLSRSQPEVLKKMCLNSALNHLDHVEVQRAYYQSIVAQVGPLVMTEGTLGQHAPCSYDGLVHYSFDYLQNIHLPHYRDQLGPLNFLNGYKVSLFGVAIEPLQKFVLYVIPEYIHKGINLVVSLLHHFFDNYALGESHVVCHAVANQNRNSTVIQYALWRVISGLHKSFQMSFLPSGHAKFAPDLYFGLFKSKFRESDVNSLMDVCQVASLSDRTAITAVIVANQTGESYVNTYDWKAFFSEHSLSSMPDVSSFAHFKTDSTNPGSVMCSELFPNHYSDPIRVFDSTFGTQILNVIKPEPLPSERQEYLYRNVRSFVAPEFQDLLCPVPKDLDSSICNVRKYNPKTPNTMLSKDELYDQNTRKRNVCSYCGEVGHRNQTIQGKYVCPKRQAANEASTVKSKDIKPCDQCVSTDLGSNLDPKVKQEQSVAKTSVQGKTKKPPACSYCGVVGHRNIIKNGIYFCRKRWSDLATSLSNITTM